MSMRMAGFPIAFIVCPTLDREKGSKVVGKAIATAGVVAKGIVVKGKPGEGGVAPANRGFKIALGSEAPYITYINDDVDFPQRNWMKRLIEEMESDRTIGVVGPSGHCRTVPQTHGTSNMDRGSEEVRWLSFFCVVIRRSLLEILGGFDPIYHHYGVDNEFCEMTRVHHMKCVWVHDVYVEHNLSPVLAQYKNRDAEIFNARWM